MVVNTKVFFLPPILYIHIHTRAVGEMPLFSLVGSGNPLEIAAYMLVQ